MKTATNYTGDQVIKGPIGLYVFWIGHTQALKYIGANLWRNGTGVKLFLNDGRP